MTDYLLSRTISSVLNIPSETDPTQFSIYNIFMDQANGCCVLHDGKSVNLDLLEPSEGKMLIEQEILRVTTAISALSQFKK